MGKQSNSDSQLEKQLAKAISLHQQGELDKAEKQYRAILKKHPDHPDALYLFGMIAHARGRVNQAIDSINKAIQVNPANPGYHFNLGVILQGAGKLQEAANAYEQSLSLQPDNPEAWDNIGTLLQQTGQYPEAAEAHSKALELKPLMPGAWNNQGEALRRLGLLDDAISCYQKALELAPDFADAATNLGNVYKETGQIDKALEIFSQTLSMKSNDSSLNKTHWNQGLAFLQEGRYREGWIEYEWGITGNERDIHRYPYPACDSRELAGKHLLISGEQGIGDEIMFASCFSDATQEAAAVTIECDPRLEPLFKRSFPDAAIYPRTGDDPGKENINDSIDCQVSAGSLPRICRNHETDFPKHNGFLVADEDKLKNWQQRFAELGDGLKIGISWRGGKEDFVRQKRSTTLEQWLPLLTLEDTHFINLQYGNCDEELQQLQQQHGITIHDWPDANPLKDLDNFAAEVAALDLVISVDNTTVHMAGALNIPVWNLLPYAADWRWQRDRIDTPWYPGMRLLRQPQAGDWDSVFSQAGKLLQALRDGDEISEPRYSDGLLKVVLLNDTSAWYHWGCTCTSSAIIGELRNIGFEVTSIPTNEIYDCVNTPRDISDFDSQEFCQAFADSNASVIQRIAEADVVVINGEGTLHNVGKPALNLLYLAYISKLALNKPVHIINHSCYPEDVADITDAEKNGLYKKVYLHMDSIAIRENISTTLMQQLGLNVIQSFDCLPLYLKQQGIQPQTERDNCIVIAGSVSWDAAYLPVLTGYMQQMHEQGYIIKVLTGARAFPAPDDTDFITALEQQDFSDWELVSAESASDWLLTIGSARLLVSGRFHHSIAAAFLKTPFIAMNSNTPKMDGLMNMLDLVPPTPYSSDDLGEFLVSRTNDILENPAAALAGDTRLEELLGLSLNNFAIIHEMAHQAREVKRRLSHLDNHETDYTRWSADQNLNPDWDKRAEIAGTMIPEHSVVLDLGCGAMTVEKMVPESCTYLPCDVVARDNRTQVCDFNANEYPDKQNATLASILGVIEYLHEPEAFMKRVREYNLPVVISYCIDELSEGWDRNALGMANHMRKDEFLALAAESGFRVVEEKPVDDRQMLFRLEPA